MTDPSAADPAAALAAELTGMAEADQAAASGANGDLDAQLAWRRLTARHGDRLDQIMTEHGWPTTEQVGPAAARGAWLVAQHADRQLDVQRRAARLLADAVAAGRAHPRELAFLVDRVRVNEGRPQVYGTQIAGVRDGAPVPWPCAEPDRVDELRAQVGIEPLAAYAARFAPG